MKFPTWLKNVFSALAILVGGFVLFNIAFAGAALIINGTNRLLGMDEFTAPHPLGIFAVLLILGSVSWTILKSNLNSLLKATYATLPMMVVLAAIGIRFYEQPIWVPLSIGGGFLICLLYYFFKKKLPWVYYFALAVVGLAGIMMVYFPM